MTAVCVGPQAGSDAVRGCVHALRVLWDSSCTNDAAESACCKVVAAEELDLLLGFGEGGSHVDGGWCLKVADCGFAKLMGVCLRSLSE